ncbi:DUF3302 domain-containing protein [Tamlana sp. s12]|uniref:DUF3302 domain-containing protein n=1 Tax=Tamlana sp. s12 TaxID=1630406 RepID=UPI0008388C22|nr:DUF3302 domain-containing protein [Tamlana sp. s12]QQY83590.1 DUF3302 domain-containing protein [Tamlana sp. s12]
MLFQPSKKRHLSILLFLLPLLISANNQEGGVEDTIAEVVSWIVIIIVPFVCIGLFLFVHVLPEKIAEKRNHPQAEAIKVLCILSLFFGGLLWPLAWLWAYSKPVFYKMAYGTDKGDYHETTLKEFKEGKSPQAETQPDKNEISETETNNEQQKKS